MFYADKAQKWNEKKSFQKAEKEVKAQKGAPVGKWCLLQWDSCLLFSGVN